MNRFVEMERRLGVLRVWPVAIAIVSAACGAGQSDAAKQPPPAPTTSASSIATNTPPVLPVPSVMASASAVASADAAPIAPAPAPRATLRPIEKVPNVFDVLEVWPRRWRVIFLRDMLVPGGKRFLWPIAQALGNVSEVSSTTTRIADGKISEKHTLRFDQIGHLVEIYTERPNEALGAKEISLRHIYDQKDEDLLLGVTETYGEKNWKPGSFRFEYKDGRILREYYDSHIVDAPAYLPLQHLHIYSNALTLEKSLPVTYSHEEHWEYKFDKEMRVERVQDKTFHNVYRYWYDKADRITKLENRDDTWFFTYSERGVLTKARWELEKATRMTIEYDEKGLPTQWESNWWSELGKCSFAYSDIGLPATATCKNVRIDFTYTPR